MFHLNTRSSLILMFVVFGVVLIPLLIALKVNKNSEQKPKQQTEIKIDSLSQKPLGAGKLKKVDSNEHMEVYEYTNAGDTYVVFVSEYEFVSAVKK